MAICGEKLVESQFLYVDGLVENVIFMAGMMPVIASELPEPEIRDLFAGMEE